MVRELFGDSVLVTGGAGFVGSALVKRLLDNDNHVVVVDNLAIGTRSNLREAAGREDIENHSRLNFVEANVREVDFERLLTRYDVRHVVHLAAEPYVPNSYDRPRAFLDLNAGVTLDLLQACASVNVERVLHYSTSEVYGTAQEVPMDESHRLFPQSTYAVSKLAADRLCFSQYHEHDVPVVILRQFNCYGPRETHPYVVPEIIGQLSTGRRLDLGNVEAKRDLTYVEDAVRAAAKLLNCRVAEGEVVNVGYGQSVSIRELAHRIADVYGYDRIDIETDRERLRPLDVQNLVCDYSKASDLVGYEPQVSLQEGLQRTVEWYEENGRWPFEAGESVVTEST